MKIYMFLISCLFLCTMASYAQDVPGGTAYLLFNDSSKEKCQQNEHYLKKFRKVDTRKKFTFFYVCSELFVFNKEGGIPDTTSMEKVPSDKIVDINEMIKSIKAWSLNNLSIMFMIRYTSLKNCKKVKF